VPWLIEWIEKTAEGLSFCRFLLTFFQKTLDKQKDFEYNNTIELKPMIQKSS